ncbi:glycosyltransferase family 8 protein [Rhizobiaceae bacterium BDR2-2]|uniref:Glycosyltransferase family 8 protein n=1 Tax=Ectorhizobium quercum TaxID=2965071 RepID=A0AAE3MZV3_9HYPH|nr:glycosyltransferase family 8 protein [Ectorhizobium quercum]MCX8996227.1 glycosyltransferase family 8 protein [Ectorhizobium quercum]MCX8998734.1 glycosyltransferase family 8 protein [Ectorhizobium quercum]
MTIDIVLSADRGVLYGLATTVRSALESSSDIVNVHVLATGFSEKDRADLKRSWAHGKCGTVAFYDVPAEKLAPFRSTKYLKSKSAYARYFIALLPADVTRCIYLDTDLLVMRDLAEAARMDLAGHPIAAVADVSVRTRKSWPELRARLGLQDERTYFNSGFLIIDLTAWRAHDIEQALVDISIAAFDRLDSQDQDALNLVFENKTLLLDPDWNTSQYERPERLEGRIIHLIGTVKPWHARYAKKLDDPYMKNVMYDGFYGILDRTAYRGYRPWNVAGLGALAETFRGNIPTRDMIAGKLRRMVSRNG